MISANGRTRLNGTRRNKCSQHHISILTFIFCLLLFFSVNTTYAVDYKKTDSDNQPMGINRDGLNYDETKQFVSNWLQMSEYDEKLELLMSLYLEKVVFYKQKNANRSFMREDKRKYYNRWPQRKYSLISVEMIPDLDYYSKPIIVNYHFELKSREKSLQGDAESFLWLDKKNNRIFIALETGHVLAMDSNKTVSKKAGYHKKRLAPADIPRTVIMDSQTGYTIFPEKIEIHDSKTHKIMYREMFTKDESMSEFRDGLISSSFLASLPVPPGSYDCRVITTNYDPTTSYCRVGAKLEQETSQKSPHGQIERYDINITPIEKPPEYRDEILQSLKREDSEVLIGFIVDDDTGLPISEVCVGSADGSISTKSNDRGFFMIRFPLENLSGVNITDVVFEKEGYRAEERDYYDAWPYGVSMTRVRLVPGEGRNIIDERKNRRRGQVPDRKIVRKPCRL